MRTAHHREPQNHTWKTKHQDITNDQKCQCKSWMSLQEKHKLVETNNMQWMAHCHKFIGWSVVVVS